MSCRWSAAAAALLTIPALAFAQRGGRGGGFGGGGATPENSAAFAASAPTFPTSDPIIKRIWAMGMDSSHTEQLGEVLFDSLGPRLMGSPDIKRAQDWLVKTYASFGIPAKEERYGTWRGWIRGHSHIDLIAPRVRTLEATMLGWSPGTGGKDEDFTTIILPHFNDSTEFVRWLPQAKGKLVLVNAPPATCRPTDDWQANAAPEVAARMDSLRGAVNGEWNGRGRAGTPGYTGVQGTGYSLALGGGELGLRLEAGGAGGIVTSRPKNGWGSREIFETYNKTTPAISLSCEDYQLVFLLTQHNQHPKLRLNLVSKLLGEKPVFNVVATIKGSTNPDQYVVLSSHFDSWDGSSGATDNGTGTLTMLEAMRILKQVLPHPKRTIIAGHWSGEEEGEVGSKAFTEDHPEVIAGLQALFNQDNGTGRIVRIGAGGLLDDSAHLNRWMDVVPAEFKTQTGGGPYSAGRPAGGGSDDYSFTCYGAPTFGLGALSWDYSNYTWHTDRDTYDKIVFDDLHANATLTAMLAYLASEDPTQITRERVDLVAMARADSIAAASRGGGRGFGRGGRGGGTQWPACEKAPRTTNPRLK